MRDKQEVRNVRIRVIGSVLISNYIVIGMTGWDEAGRRLIVGFVKEILLYCYSMILLQNYIIIIIIFSYSRDCVTRAMCGFS